MKRLRRILQIFHFLTSNSCLIRFAQKNNLPHLDFCTVPRTGALVIALEILGPNSDHAKLTSTNGNTTINGGLDGITSSVAPPPPPSSQFTKLVDVTIAYPKGDPLDLIAIFTGYRRPCSTHVHYRIYDIKEVSYNKKLVCITTLIELGAFA